LKYSFAADITKHAVKYFETTTTKLLHGFEQALKGKDWLVGDSISLADIAWFASSHNAFVYLLGAEFRKEIPLVVAHFRKLEALPEFKAVVGDPVKFPEHSPILEFEEKDSEVVKGDVTFKYFALRARGEAIRLSLADAGVKYKEENPKEWSEERIAGVDSGLLPFGQLPLLIHGDISLVQSGSILRYLGQTFNLAGVSKKEHILVDQLLGAAEDLRTLLFGLIYKSKQEEKAKETHLKQAHEHFENIERILKRTKSDYLASKQFTVADAAWFDLLDGHVRIYSDFLQSHPLLKAWYDRVTSRPNIAAYLISDRRPTKIW